ncbi:MAG TPA: hypothetical protein PKD86_07530 [Gemmatales bacterium]|nr:hypothetical protein [Gemmatales bacterium]
MATRLHATAIRHDHLDEVRRTFVELLGPGFEGVEITAHGGWLSFCTSVWGVNSKNLLKGLCALGRPGLNFTTEDDSRWYGTVVGAPGQPTFIHEHSLYAATPSAEWLAHYEQPEPEEEEIDPALSFLEEPPPPGGPRNAPLDRFLGAQGFAGMTIPDELRARLLALPITEAVLELRQWSVQSFIDALAAAQIPHDPEAVRATLLWENLTPAERDSSLGNLPRLLSVLGLGGQWDKFVHESEHPEQVEPETCELEPSPPPPDVDAIAPVLARLAGTSLTPLADQALNLPLDRAARITFLADLARVEGQPLGVVFTFTWPADAERKVSLPAVEIHANEEEVQWIVEPGRLRVGFTEHETINDCKLSDWLGKKVTQWMKKLPEGVRLEVAMAAAEPTTTHQRFAGPIKGKDWQVEESYPALPGDVLREALDWSARTEKSSFTAVDEAEFEAIMRVIRRDPQLTNLRIKQKGLKIQADWDVTGELARVFARQRLRDRFDLSAQAAAQSAGAAKRRQERREMMRGMVAAARARSAPHDAAILYRGKHTLFWASDFMLLDQLEPEPRDQFTKAVTDLGFTLVGDFVAKKFRDFVLRCWISDDRKTYAIMTAKRSLYLSIEFFTRFANKMTLTTTTNSSVDSRPKKGVFYKVLPGLGGAELHAKHVWGIQQFESKHGTQPVPLEPTLLGVVQEFDQALGRMPQR